MDHMRLRVVRVVTALIVTMALAAVPASVAAADRPADAGSCVGQFSSYFAQGGSGIHRSDVARNYAHNARPAGLIVYSHVADGHGSLNDCFAMF